LLVASRTWKPREVSFTRSEADIEWKELSISSMNMETMTSMTGVEPEKKYEGEIISNQGTDDDGRTVLSMSTRRVSDDERTTDSTSK